MQVNSLNMSHAVDPRGRATRTPAGCVGSPAQVNQDHKNRNECESCDNAAAYDSDRDISATERQCRRLHEERQEEASLVQKLQSCFDTSMAHSLRHAIIDERKQGRYKFQS